MSAAPGGGAQPGPGAAPTLSVLVPVTRPWPTVEPVLASIADQVTAVGGEVLVLDGHGGALAAPPAEGSGLRWLLHPGADVFALRAHGLAAARAPVVVVTEDHCTSPAGWCRAVLDAHADHPEAAAVVGAVANGTTARVLDRANFLLTFALFLPPLRELPTDRAPTPTNLALKRAALPDPPYEPGWLEYRYVPELIAAGRAVGVGTPEITVRHDQSHGGARTVFVHFQSGRSAGAGLRTLPTVDRRAAVRRLPRLPAALVRRTADGVAASGTRAERRDLAAVAVLAAANVAGQFTGLLLGSGRSRHDLV
jgi:hypothetical protein